MVNFYQKCCRLLDRNERFTLNILAETTLFDSNINQNYDDNDRNIISASDIVKSFEEHVRNTYQEMKADKILSVC